MDIRILSSSMEEPAYQFAASYLVNDVLAIDAGSIGFAELDRQRNVRWIVLSHAHLDHIASLPMFLDNVYESGQPCPIVYASQHVIDLLRTHFFNDLVWPDVVRLSRDNSPFVRFVEVKDGEPVTINGFVVTPVALNHVIPTMGFVVDDGTSAVAFVSDTAPTEAIWELVRKQPRMSALFLESAFPNSMSWLAEKSMHLTPAMFAEEYAKLGKTIPVIAIHIKPPFYDAVVKELTQLNLDQLVISQPNHVYRY